MFYLTLICYWLTVQFDVTHLLSNRSCNGWRLRQIQLESSPTDNRKSQAKHTAVYFICQLTQ